MSLFPQLQPTENDKKVIMKTNKGDITIRLFPDMAPILQELAWADQAFGEILLKMNSQ